MRSTRGIRAAWLAVAVVAWDGRTLPDDVPVEVYFAADEIDGSPLSNESGSSLSAVEGDYAANSSRACSGQSPGPCWNVTGWCGPAAAAALASRQVRLSPSVRVQVQDNDTASATLVPVGAASVSEGGTRRISVALSQQPVTGTLSFQVVVDAATSSGVQAPWLRTSVGPAEGWSVVAGVNSTGSGLERTVALAGDSTLSSSGTVGLRLTGAASSLPRFQIAAAATLATYDATLRGLVVDGVATSAGSGACAAAETEALLGWRDPALGVTAALSGASKVFVAPVETVAPGGFVTVPIRLTASPMESATVALQAQSWRWDDAAGVALPVLGSPVAAVTPAVLRFSSSNWSTAVSVVISVASAEATAFLASGRNASVSLAVVSVTTPIGATDPLHLPNALAAAVGLRLPSMRASAQTTSTAGVLRLLRFAQPGLSASTPGCSGGTAWLNGGGSAAWTVRLASQPEASISVILSSSLLATKQLLLADPLPENSASAPNGSLRITIMPSEWNSGVAVYFDRNASSAPGAYTAAVTAVVDSAVGDGSYNPEPDPDADANTLQLTDAVHDAYPDADPVCHGNQHADPIGYRIANADAVSDRIANANSQSDAVTDADTDVNADVDRHIHPDADADTDADPDGNPDAVTDSDTDVNADVDRHIHPDADADTDADTDADPNPDPDQHSDVHAHPDAHADSDAEQFPDAVALPDPVSHALGHGIAEPRGVA